MNTRPEQQIPSSTNSRLSLLDREAPPGYIEAWTAHVAAQKKATDTETETVVIFRCGTEWLALSTHFFQEVVDQYTIRTMPHQRGKLLKGLVSVRGDLLLCFELETLLRLAQEENPRPGSSNRLVILSRKGERSAIQVAEVLGVHRFERKDLQPVPATLVRAASRNCIAGILPWQGRSIGCLDGAHLLDTLNESLA